MPRGRPRHPDVLTPREWEVLALLRERLTNQQIAERLAISENGAKYHVLEILSKLGVSSRYEAAAWEREPAAVSRRYAGLAVILALKPPKLSALAASRAAMAVLATTVFAFLALLAVGVAVMNQRASGSSLAPEVTSQAIVGTATAIASNTPTVAPTETPPPVDPRTPVPGEQFGAAVPPPAWALTVGPLLTPQAGFPEAPNALTGLPASAAGALSSFANSEGSSYAGACSASTQPGQICYATLEGGTPVLDGQTIQVQLRVSGESVAYQVTLVPTDAGDYQIGAVSGPSPFSIPAP